MEVYISAYSTPSLARHVPHLEKVFKIPDQDHVPKAPLISRLCHWDMLAVLPTVVGTWCTSHQPRNVARNRALSNMTNPLWPGPA